MVLYKNVTTNNNELSGNNIFDNVRKLPIFECIVLTENKIQSHEH